MAPTRPKPIDVTVVVAAYNAAGTIERAVRSALAQEAVTLEVIVADDASTDGTADVAAALDDPQLGVLRLARNGGPARARNVALDVARGEWIAVLDADDAFAPGRLARMIARGRQTGADAVVDNLLVRSDGEPDTPMFPPEALAHMPAITLSDFVRANHPFAAGLNLGYTKPLIRNAAIQRTRARYDEELRIGEDYVFLADILADGATCAIDPTCGYLYTRASTSISARLTSGHVIAMRSADEHFLARHPHLAKDSAVGERRRALSRALAFTLAVESLKRRDLAGAMRALAPSPGALVHFRYPVAARLDRMLRSSS